MNLTSRDALRIFDLADIWAARSGNEVRLVSGNDHVHSRGSAHYLGEALDFHSSDPDGLSTLFRGAGYRVLWKVPGHYAHVHVERQVTDRSPERPLYQVTQERSRSSARRSRVGG